MTTATTISVRRDSRQQVDSITLDRAGMREQFINARQGGAGGLPVLDCFPPDSGHAAAQMVFGGCRFYEAGARRMAGTEWPLLWVQGDVCPGDEVSGAQMFVLHGEAPRRLMLDGRVAGTVWSDEDADYCLLAGIGPEDLTRGRGEQTTSCFERIEAVLSQAGFDFSHVARTWFYLDRLLAWYDEFNSARTAFFHSRGVFDRLIPASTGIGAANPAGAALACGVLALRLKHDGARVCEVDSPLQRPATEYRSSFSRAVELSFPDRRMLLISGTASIAPDGASMYEADVVKQIHRTLDVVEAILKSRGMGWRDATRAVSYFRDIGALPVFEACRRERGIPRLPVVSAHATVCRADLLYELELDAVAAR